MWKRRGGRQRGAHFVGDTKPRPVGKGYFIPSFMVPQLCFSTKELASEDSAEYAEAAEKAFRSLVEHVEEKIIGCPETVIKMSALWATYVQFLQQQGVDVESYRTYLLKARLIDHFPEQLSFHRPQKRNVTEFVFSRDMPTGILAEKCALAIEAAERAVDESLTTCDIVGWIHTCPGKLTLNHC